MASFGYFGLANIANRYSFIYAFSGCKADLQAKFPVGNMTDVNQSFLLNILVAFWNSSIQFTQLFPSNLAFV